MLELVTGHIPCLLEFVGDPLKAGASIAALIAAALLLAKIRDKNASVRARTALVFVHLALLLFPLAFFLFTMTCTTNPLHCQTFGALTSILYSIGGAIGGALLLGVVVIPSAYISSRKSRKVESGTLHSLVRRAARNMGAKVPRIYSIDDPKPYAFSFSGIVSAIFVSVGLQEILSEKELEAVALHEVAHVKSGSSLYKFSTLILRVFSPVTTLKGFSSELSEEERKADGLAAAMQGTSRHLNSAKRKIAEFERLSAD